MANLPTLSTSDTGAFPVLPDLVDTSNSVEVGSGHNTVLMVENSNASTRTLTIVVAGLTEYGEPNPDKTYNLAANTGRLMIPLRKAYVDPLTTGRVTFTVSNVTGVKAAPVRVV